MPACSFSSHPRAPRAQLAPVFGSSFSLVLRGSSASQKQMQARVSSRPAAGLQRLFTHVDVGPADLGKRPAVSAAHADEAHLRSSVHNFPIPVPLHWPDCPGQVQDGMACDRHVGQVLTVVMITTWSLLGVGGGLMTGTCGKVTWSLCLQPCSFSVLASGWDPCCLDPLEGKLGHR